MAAATVFILILSVAQVFIRHAFDAWGWTLVPYILLGALWVYILKNKSRLRWPK